MTRRFLLVALALLGPGLALAPSASPVGGSVRQPEWAVRDLGVRGDAIAINARGQVVGDREQRPNRPRA